MKVIAYMPVFEEADVLLFTLAHMRTQGIDVHVIDGWSKDGSYEIACSMPGVTAERFPAGSDDGVWNCRRTLAHIEELAAASGADWCYLSDADEFRRSGRPGETLVEAISRLDAAGYNAIDHQVYSFMCVDANWSGNPENYFRYYDPKDMIARLPQQKAWKNTGRWVDLQSTGGHAVNFPGKRVAQEKFVMKHYAYRTPEQARRKLATRMERRCQEEHKAGWGVHYDEAFPKEFCWDPAQLEEWPSDKMKSAREARESSPSMPMASSAPASYV